jgi:hypothetical protein
MEEKLLWFSRAVGWKFSADMFSIFQTLERNEINPKLWLTDYLEACAKNGGSPEDAAKYLPWNLSEEQRKAWTLKSSPMHEPKELTQDHQQAATGFSRWRNCLD